MTDLTTIPEEHRRTIALWLEERASRCKPSWIFPEQAAFAARDALAGAAVDLFDPDAEDSTVEHAAQVLAGLRPDADRDPEQPPTYACPHCGHPHPAHVFSCAVAAQMREYIAAELGTVAYPAPAPRPFFEQVAEVRAVAEDANRCTDVWRPAHAAGSMVNDCVTCSGGAP